MSGLIFLSAVSGDGVRFNPCVRAIARFVSCLVLSRILFFFAFFNFLLFSNGSCEFSERFVRLVFIV